MKKIFYPVCILLCSCANTDTKKEVPNTEKNKETAAATQKDTGTTKNNTVTLPVENSNRVSNDTVYIAKNTVVLHDAAKAEVDKWQKEAGENFAESLSDNLHYMDETNTEAKKQNLTILKTDKNIIIFVGKSGEKNIWKRGKNFEGWGAIAFKENGAPQKIDITDAATGLKKYFK